MTYSRRMFSSSALVLVLAACCCAPVAVAFSTPFRVAAPAIVGPRQLLSHSHSPTRASTPSPTALRLAVGADTDSSQGDSGDSPSSVQDILAGLTVAFSLLSKAVACSAIVGVNPLVGLWSSVVMGITAPLMGSRAGVISGTAAVVIVPLSTLVRAHGVEYMPLCILVSALMQGLFGVFRLASMAKLVTEQVLSGFLNGLGLILLLSQAKIFQTAAKNGTLGPAVSMAALCFSIVQGLPRFTKAVPSSLVGLVVASGVGAAFKLPLETLASSSAEGTFAGGLSSLPSLIDLVDLRTKLTSLSALQIVMPAAISIMIIALVETLLAGKVVEDMTGQKLCEDDEEEGCIPTDYDVPTRSVLALSAGNALSAFLGGFGGCGLIPQTVLNIKSGGGGPLSSASYAAAMAAFVVLFAPLVGKISQAALAGIMITVAYDTVAWGSTAKAIKAVFNPAGHPNIKGGAAVGRVQRLIELFTLGLSSCICYFGNLAVGIIAGVLSQRVLLAIHRRLSSSKAEPASN